MIIINGETIRIWKEAVVAYLKAMSRHYQENFRETSVCQRVSFIELPNWFIWNLVCGRSKS